MMVTNNAKENKTRTSKYVENVNETITYEKNGKLRFENNNSWNIKYTNLNTVHDERENPTMSNIKTEKAHDMSNNDSTGDSRNSTDNKHDITREEQK